MYVKINRKFIITTNKKASIVKEKSFDATQLSEYRNLPYTIPYGTYTKCFTERLFGKMIKIKAIFCISISILRIIFAVS